MAPVVPRTKNVTVMPTGATAGPIDWPVPGRVAEGALMTYAYTGEVLLPVTVTPAPGSGGMTVKAHANWLVCRDICVPEEGDFRLDLPAGNAAPSAQAPLFASADRQTPRPSPWRAVIGHDGTLSVQGPELTPATVADEQKSMSEEEGARGVTPARKPVSPVSLVKTRG